MRVGQSRRRDKNEGEIRQALEQAGCETWAISGKGAPDLLARRGGRYFAMEVKGAKGKRTKAQEASQHPIVKTPEEALKVISIEGR